MVSALSLGCSVSTYEGSPQYPHLDHLFRLVAAHQIDCFGTSPRFIAACQDQHLEPKDWDLSSLKTVLTTGAPLLPDQFRWIYQHVKANVHLASISGGTDILGCFMLGNPMLPVKAGEIQGPGLGMAVEAFDDNCQPVIGQKGELVCTRPFPSMPLYFLDDELDQKYRQAYFDFYPQQEIWRHGDFIQKNPDGGIIVFGRSDATLNPGGVRIGTAEIYRPVEQIAEIADSLACSINDEIALFVTLNPMDQKQQLDALGLQQKIRQVLRSQLSPRHVPKYIFVVKEIPYTRSGKKVELAVQHILKGMPVQNQTALINPQCFLEYEAIAQTYFLTPHQQREEG